MTGCVLILTTLPASGDESIPKALVEERLAACVSVIGPITSFYRWEGAIERDVERQLVIKTTPERIAAVEMRLRELHPYDVPEFLVIPVAGGGNAYLEWLTSAASPD